MSHRVVMATFEYGPIRLGGLAAMLTSLCAELDPARFTPVVVLPRSGEAPAWPRIARHTLARGEVDVYRDGHTEVWLLDGPLMAGPIYPEPACIAGIKKIDEYGERVADLLALLEADVLHLHDAYGYKALYAARKHGVPSLLTVHRLHDDEPPTAFGEIAAVRLVDEVSTVSASYARERHDFFAARERVHVIGNGIDPTYWREPAGDRGERLRALQRALNLPARPTFACVGRLDADQKGLDVLLAAHASRPDLPINVIIAGDGDPALAAQIAGVRSPAVRFVHRQLARDEVRDLLAAVDGVVIPSRYEPFGLIQLEAMALGALPIAARTGGLRDVIRDVRESDTGFGWLFEVGDAAGLAATLAQLASLPRDAWPALRQRAQACASQYTARATAAGYEALYTDLLARAAPRGLRRAG